VHRVPQERVRSSFLPVRARGQGSVLLLLLQPSLFSLESSCYFPRQSAPRCQDFPARFFSVGLSSAPQSRGRFLRFSLCFSVALGAHDFCSSSILVLVLADLIFNPPDQRLEFSFLIFLMLRSWFLCHVHEVVNEMCVRQFI
jgi:hypothetical protein